MAETKTTAKKAPAKKPVAKKAPAKKTAPEAEASVAENAGFVKMIRERDGKEVMIAPDLVDRYILARYRRA